MEEKTPCRVLVRKPEEKEPSGQPTPILEDNIKRVWTEFIRLSIGTSGGLL
jgi:hypothetical protein